MFCGVAFPGSSEFAVSPLNYFSPEVSSPYSRPGAADCELCRVWKPLTRDVRAGLKTAASRLSRGTRSNSCTSSSDRHAVPTRKPQRMASSLNTGVKLGCSLRNWVNSSSCHRRWKSRFALPSSAASQEEAFVATSRIGCACPMSRLVVQSMGPADLGKQYLGDDF